MTFTELIALYAGQTREEQTKDLASVLAKVISDKYGDGIRALPKIAEAIPVLTNNQTPIDTIPLLKVLDAIIECIAVKMIECKGFDLLDLRSAAKEFMLSEIERRNTTITEAQNGSL